MKVKNNRLLLPIISLAVFSAMQLLRKKTICPFLYYLQLPLAAYFCYTLLKSESIKRFLPKKIAVSPQTLAVLLSSLFLVLAAVMTIVKYHAFSTYMVDFGNMTQAIWNTTQGRLLELTSVTAPYQNMSRLSFHVEVFYLFIAGMYKLMPFPEILLILQSAFLAMSIYLIFLIGIELTGNGKTALAVATAFALFPSLQFMALFDIHGEVFSLPFILGMYLSYLKKNKVLHWVFLILALFCKEYVALALCGYGIALGLQHRDWKTGGAVFLCSALYFYCAMFIIIPHFNNGNESVLIRNNYAALGGDSGLFGILSFMVLHPFQTIAKTLNCSNLENLYYLFFPLAFLCFLRPLFLLPVIPVMVKDLLFGMDIYNHHPAPALPFIFISVFLFLGTRKKYKQKDTVDPVAVFLLCCSVIGGFAYGPFPNGHRFWREIDRYRISEMDQVTSKMLRKIPSSSVVSVSGHIAPHLAHRRYCYIFPHPPGLEQVEYVLVDTAVGDAEGWNSLNNVKEAIPQMEQSGFDLVERHKSLFLFRRNTEH